MKKENIAFKILVYSLAIEALGEGRYGFCGSICSALSNLGANCNKSYVMAYNQMREHFPEIWQHRPCNADDFWWPMFEHQIRLDILGKEIEKLYNQL